MKLYQSSSFISFIFLSVFMFEANAGILKDDMSFPSAIEYSLKLLDKSPYKTIEINTTSGSFSGDFVTKTTGIIVLKNKTGSIDLKTGKEKLIMSYIDISTITGISVYIPEAL